MINPNNFDISINHSPNHLYCIKNAKGMVAQVMNYGAKLVSLYVPDADGNPVDIVLGFDNLADYLSKEPYFGAICGRCANRIAHAQFTLNEKHYQLSQNAEKHHLHGGFSGFNVKMWKTERFSDDSVTFSYTSPDGEEGYPANLISQVTYKVTEENQLCLNITAVADGTTIASLCHHPYFNLKGGKGTIHSHQLQINADFYTELDDDFICTGKICTVNHHPTDFRQFKAIGKVIDNPFFKPGKGLDYNWIIHKNLEERLTLAAQLLEPENGICLKVYTDFSGLQVYTGNYIENEKGKYGLDYQKHSAICLEAQFFPNAANIPEFPSVVLKPNEIFNHNIIYQI